MGWPPVSWMSTLQSIVALSTNEAAMIEAIKEAIWPPGLIEDLDTYIFFSQREGRSAVQQLESSKTSLCFRWSPKLCICERVFRVYMGFGVLWEWLHANLHIQLVKFSSHLWMYAFAEPRKLFLFMWLSNFLLFFFFFHSNFLFGNRSKTHTSIHNQSCVGVVSRGLFPQQLFVK